MSFLNKIVILKIFLLSILLIVSLCVTAQHKKIYNLPNYDTKVLHFGFLIAYNQYDFVIKNNANFRSMDTIKSITSTGQPGFNLGIVSDLRLGDYFDLRFLPDLSFAERQMHYIMSFNNQSIEQVKPVESTFINIPSLLKFKSARLNNFRAYVVAGVKYSYDLASLKNAIIDPSNPRIRLYKNDFLYEVGVGFDFYLEYFKFAPELKFTFGTQDMLKHDGTLITNAINQLTSKAVTLNFQFE